MDMVQQQPIVSPIYHRRALPKHHLWLAFGGNQGDVLATFTQALATIPVRLDGLWLAISPVYRTPALLPPGVSQPMADYWNMACHLAVHCSLEQCWDTFQALERQSGRRSRTRWDARPLDIDILWADPLPAKLPDLSLPHPRLHERGFVLTPLMDIAADLVLPPFDCPVATLWQRLPAHEQIMLEQLPPLVPVGKNIKTIVEKSALD